MKANDLKTKIQEYLGNNNGSAPMGIVINSKELIELVSEIADSKYYTMVPFCIDNRIEGYHLIKNFEEYRELFK